MKLKPNIDAIAFLEQVRKCREEVFLTTTDGDSINLKSLLSQYVFVAILDNRKIMERSEIRCQNESDQKLLTRYCTDSVLH